MNIHNSGFFFRWANIFSKIQNAIMLHFIPTSICTVSLIIHILFRIKYRNYDHV